MKLNIIIVCLVICTMMYALIGCTEVVSEVPIDTEYIEAYSAMESVYEYRYDWYHGDFVYVPVLKQVHHSAEYKVQYKVTYSDGTTDTRWRTVDKATYEETLKQLEGKR